MFSQLKQNKQGGASTFSNSFSGGLPPPTKQEKPRSAAERYQQALVTANVYLEGSRARVQHSMNEFNGVANNSYWFYGYGIGSMMSTMGLCLVLANRWTVFRTYSGWIALVGGYLGGKACVGIHTGYLLNNVMQRLDHEIEEAKRMDEQTEHIVPDYLQEAKRLTQVKQELLPSSAEAGEGHAGAQPKTLDQQADDIIDAYMQRRAALQKK